MHEVIYDLKTKRGHRSAVHASQTNGSTLLASVIFRYKYRKNMGALIIKIKF